MNIRPRSPAALKAALAGRLSRLLGSVPWLKGWRMPPLGARSRSGAGLLARLPLPAGGKADLRVHCRQDLRPSLFGSLMEQSPAASNPMHLSVRVLGMPFLSPRLRDLCAAHGWSWFDLAGNCRLDVPGLLRLEHTGERPVYRVPRPRANLGTSEAGRILRVLLAPEHAGKRWTQRGLQTQSSPGVSIGLVNKVVRHLKEEAFVGEAPEGGFLLDSPLALLEAWREVYRFDRQERRGYFSLLQGDKLREALASLDLQAGGGACTASFSAADLQAPDVRQPKTWLYVREAELPRLEALLEAKPVEGGENIVVLLPRDDGVFHLADVGPAGGRRMRCTNPVQTYLDLYHAGGRGREAAEALLEQRLKPAWRARGLLK